MTHSEAFKKNPIMVISNLLVIIGALNWLGIGLMNTNYVLQYSGSQYARYIFILVGLAGVYLAYHTVMWYMGEHTPTTKAVIEHLTECKTIQGKYTCVPASDATSE